MKADNISAITVFFDEEPRQGEYPTDDEFSSGFTTVPEEDGEDTPPDVPAPTTVPTLKRSKGFRILNLEEAAVFVASTAAGLNPFLPIQASGHLNVKRKIASSVTSPTTAIKRCRTISEGSDLSSRQLVTDVSSKSLQSLKLDKDLTEVSAVAAEFP